MHDDTELASETRPGSELRRPPSLAGAVRRRWIHVVVGLAVGLLLGVAVAATSAPAYHAQATVRVGGGLVAVGDFTSDTLWADDQVALTRTDPVRRAVAERIGDGTDLDDVADRLSVTVEESSNYLVFTWTDDTAARAESRAETAAEVYLEQAEAQAVERWRAHDTRLAGLQDETDPEGNRGQQLVLERMRLEETVIDPGSVASEAAGTAEQSSLPTAAHVVAGGAGGLLVGIASAYLAQVRNPRRPTPAAAPAVAVAAAAPPLPTTPRASKPATDAARNRHDRLREERGEAATTRRPTGGLATFFRERGDNGGEPLDDTGLPVLAEVRDTRSDGSDVVAVGVAIAPWLLEREAEDPGEEFRLGVYVTPDLPEDAAEIVRRGLRVVGAENRLQVETVDLGRPTWRVDFEACDAVVVLVGSTSWSNDALRVARLHLAAVDVEVLGLVRVATDA
ncbi:hypothetical protein QE364_000349 [Nocardioides zeae]|uniref:Uncharacterized protein n=1 Tax=Nocardioides zeae TaxID=1457234 RepID=A0ACC6ID47_9ACTN|nr:hypothetical protein [Nocardioides zeae]MDR6175732.1 hypothetical protein [Nocardioides zeae]MDR6208661.1 hypothetical protein [Nocardioides zeae]